MFQPGDRQRKHEKVRIAGLFVRLGQGVRFVGSHACASMGRLVYSASYNIATNVQSVASMRLSDVWLHAGFEGDEGGAHVQ